MTCLATSNLTFAFAFVALVGSCVALKTDDVPNSTFVENAAASFISNVDHLAVSDEKIQKIQKDAKVPPAVNVGVKVNVTVGQHQPLAAVTSGSGVRTVWVSGGQVIGPAAVEAMQLGYLLGKHGFKLIVGGKTGYSGPAAFAFRAANPTGELTYIYKNNRDDSLASIATSTTAGAVSTEEDERTAEFVLSLSAGADYHIVFPGGKGTMAELTQAPQGLPTMCFSFEAKKSDGTLVPEWTDPSVTSKEFPNACTEEKAKIVSSADDALKILLNLQ